MLNDTRLHGGLDFSLPGFSMIRGDKNTGDSTPGGLAIAVPITWDVQQVPSITDSGNGYESVGILAAPPKGPPIKLLSLYNHPQNHAPQHLFREFINVKSNNRDVDGFIGGDLNCPHEAFSSRFSNVYGTGLLNLVNNMNLLVVEIEEPTIFHHGEPNILDLFICEPRSLQLIQECFVGDSIGSDHLPLIAHARLYTQASSGCPQRTKTFFDSAKFKEELKEELVDLDALCNSKSDVDIKLNQITNAIQKQKEKHTKSRPWRHKRLTIPHDILSWIQTRKNLLKEMKKAQTVELKRAFSQLYNKANRIVKDLLNEFDEAEKEKAILEMQNERDSCRMWKRYKTLKNQLQPDNAIRRPITNAQGENISDPALKAEIFASRLESVHQTPTHPIFDQQFEDEVVNFIQTHESLFNEQELPSADDDNSHPMLLPITKSEFKQKLGLGKSSSAPGSDGITYGLLKICPDILFEKLIEILNFCMLIGYFPKQWKDAKVIMLQKPGKDHTTPKNYRPISLLPAISKVFERLICERLVEFLEDNKLLNNYQAGYRKGRSTQEHIFRLAQQVYNGFKSQQCTYAIFLDCEAAFDAVWRDGLMYKLHHLRERRE